MAKGRRTYNRDARGRFASGSSPGGGPATKAKPKRGAKKPGGGTAPARAKLQGAAARLAAAPSPQRKGAVTRAKKALKAAKVPIRKKVARPTPLARIAKGGRRRGAPAAGPANGIRASRLKGSPRAAGNSIRPVQLSSVSKGFRGDRAKAKAGRTAAADRLTRLAANLSRAKASQKTARNDKVRRKAARSEQVARAAMAEYNRPRSKVVPFRPATMKGRIQRMERQMDREVKGIAEAGNILRNALNRAKPELKSIEWQLQRMNAKALAKRLSSRRIDRDIAAIELGIIGGRSGAKAIQRRMERAAAAAARGSKPAAKARVIYANQLAYMGTGKPAKAESNLRPGPRNTQGPPKRRRKRKPKG